MATLSVLNPVGFPPKVTRKALAPRLQTLEGKTVYLVDCRFDQLQLVWCSKWWLCGNGTGKQDNDGYENQRKSLHR